MKNFLNAIVAVIASFFGVRSSKNMGKDEKISPIYILVAGIAMLLTFVFILIFLVNLVVS